MPNDKRERRIKTTENQRREKPMYIYTLLEAESIEGFDLIDFIEIGADETC